MGLLYLVLLLVSMLGVGLVDARWRLFLWAEPKRALLVLAAGVVALLLWDLAGISTGIFAREANPLSTGILLAPHLPIEEPVFLLFLVQVTMVLYTGARRILGSREERPR
ncbi:MAG: C50 carotenoid epsilon cyclase [Microbacterium sp. 14-71-5]|jgi:lycopene cyclase domain-containing protein|uniref:lycopene cyclase domain-containing protein n=1 Tax=Microbacterium sp. 13-71-7 TaxID=1970399 RepID=UPI000BC8FEB0|nr:lycopene cyclase domain-containing protein [Microbacterium sp. 13-71-7]OZB83996.1 MAG: C50 carotenoid epsilon cyclase [Microbacterium sp. 13-71-7]OZB84801.1 MAG: C50 carotenoid epsilon cyclase [Microbacterium sp. 14-71-5]